MIRVSTDNPSPETEDVHPQREQDATGHYTMIDLFAGCGGLSRGFENARFTPVFVNEINNDAIETYLRNRHHELGGEKFAENTALRCNDAHELQGGRLSQLVADLSTMREIDFRFDTASAKTGGGSTLDILAGGPPCQGYSGIGIRRSYAVEKQEIPSNLLYKRMAEIIRRIRPRIFLFENVRGLLNARWTIHGSESIWSDVKAEFRKIPGYEIRWSLVYAKDYGVPQNRPRILLVGIRNDILAACSTVDPSADREDAVTCGFLPAGKPATFPDLCDLLDDLVDPNIAQTLRSGRFPSGTFETTSYPTPPKTAIQRHLRAAPPWDDKRRVALTEQVYSKHKFSIARKFDHMLTSGGDIPEQYRTRKFAQRVLEARWGTGQPNITATSLPDDYVHYCQPRVLTVREWARLQLFPDWYHFAGNRTTGGVRRAGNPLKGNFEREVPKYTQIGNAVPVGLAENVGHHLRALLDEALGER